MTWGSTQEHTRAVLDEITGTLALAGCSRGDVVKTMALLKTREDFPGFHTV